MSKAITHIISTAVPLPYENIDTDQIVPARFLKATSRDGFGANLFYDWRYDEAGAAKQDFVLNDERYSGRILLAGKNFGCGSSREHAAWAIKDHGFDAVISSYFADIFQANALNNFLLPVKLSEDILEALFTAVTSEPATEISIDIAAQTLAVNGNVIADFPLGSYKKTCLLNGYEDIDYLLSISNEIADFEQVKNRR